MQNIRKAILIFIIFIDLYGFYIVKFPEAINVYIRWNKMLLLGIGIFLYIIGLVKRNRIVSDICNEYIRPYTVCIVGSLLLLCIFTKISSPETSINQLIIESSPYLLIILVSFYLRIMVHDGGIDGFHNVINYTIVVWYILLIIQSNIYSQTGKIFMTESQSHEWIWQRDYGIRIGLGSIANIMILYNFYIIITRKKKKLFSYIQLALGLYCSVVVQQTRMYIITVILSMIIMFAYSGSVTSKKIRRGVLLLVGVIMLSGNVIQNYVGSFSIISDKGSSTVARLGAIEYYMSIFMKNPLFGFGFTSNSAIRNGGAGYDMTDVGFVGLLAQVGLFSIILYIFIFVRMTYILYKMKKMQYIDLSYSYMVGLYTFALFTSGSLIMTNHGRAMTIPFLLAIYEFKYYKYKKFIHNRIGKSSMR